MENAIQKIHHRKFGDVRVVILNGTVYFMGRDVATALGFKDTTRAIRAHVVAEDKKFVKPSDLRVGELPALFPNNGAFFINESGLYSLILSSKLPLAQEFKHWITSEVLPSIAKNGYYINPNAITPPPVPVENVPETELTRREKIEILRDCLKLTDCKNLRNKLIYDIARLVTNKNY